MRIGRQRQQVDQHPARRKECRELRWPGETAHPVHRLGRAAPAVDRKIKRRQRARHALTEHAQAHHADRKIVALAWFAVRPLALAHIGFVSIELAKVPNDRVAHVLSHLRRHARVVQPHHGGLRRQTQPEQGIDARADTEDAPELVLLVKELLRWRPHDGVVCAGRTRLPDLDLSLRQGGAQAFQPGLWLGADAAKADVHAATSLSSSAPSTTWSPGA